jgi:hypothetical protein
MKIYKLEKWYFDFLTPDNDFFFFYFARIRFFSYWDERIYLTLKTVRTKSTFNKSLKIKSIQFNPGQDRLVIKSEFGLIELNKTMSLIQLNINDTVIALNFRYSDYHSIRDRLTINKNSRHLITWMPITINARVSGNIQAPAGNLKVAQSDGYIDYMNSTIFPAQNPVYRLFWGRAHYSGGELAFTCAYGRQPQERWCKLYIMIMNEYIELDQVDLLTSSWNFSENLSLEYPTFYKIIGRSSDLHLEIQIENNSPLSESFFIDREFTASGALYKLYQYLALNPRGIKFLSRFHVESNRMRTKQEMVSVYGITEYVVFDRHAVPRL